MASAVSKIFWIDGRRNWFSGRGRAGMWSGQSTHPNTPAGVRIVPKMSVVVAKTSQTRRFEQPFFIVTYSFRRCCWVDSKLFIRERRMEKNNVSSQQSVVAVVVAVCVFVDGCYECVHVRCRLWTHFSCAPINVAVGCRQDYFHFNEQYFRRRLGQNHRWATANRRSAH